MSEVPSVLFLFLGWLLGVLSPIIVDGIRRRREIAEVKPAIGAELRALQAKLAATTYHIAKRFGAPNRPLLEWVKSVFDAYDGPNADKEQSKAIGALLAYPDAELTVLMQRDEDAERRALSLRSLNTPYLDSQLGHLAMLGHATQSLLAEIKVQVGFLNEQIAESRFYWQKTLDPGVSPENHQIIKDNLRDVCLQVAKRAPHLGELIERYVKDMGSSA
ncbi:MAG: hypothetical protein Q7T82_02705 [Armatimonadota bacterium]|nr:hypothetical protein [Armatimonadota bacterium]